MTIFHIIFDIMVKVWPIVLLRYQFVSFFITKMTHQQIVIIMPD